MTSAPLTALSGRMDVIEDFPRGCLVRTEQVLPLTQIVAEALMNAIKHAPPSNRRGVIRASCGMDAFGAVWVEVRDDGAGLPPAFDPNHDGGLGFRLLRGLSAQLGARLQFDSSAAGLRVRLTLPASLLICVGGRVPA
jgi:two-component sensor histidine kinase